MVFNVMKKIIFNLRIIYLKLILFKVLVSFFDYLEMLLVVCLFVFYINLIKFV